MGSAAPQIDATSDRRRLDGGHFLTLRPLLHPFSATQYGVLRTSMRTRSRTGPRSPTPRSLSRRRHSMVTSFGLEPIDGCGGTRKGREDDGVIPTPRSVVSMCVLIRFTSSTAHMRICIASYRERQNPDAWGI